MDITYKIFKTKYVVGLYITRLGTVIVEIIKVVFYVDFAYIVKSHRGPHSVVHLLDVNKCWHLWHRNIISIYGVRYSSIFMA